MKAEIIAVGDELTSGQRLDTNSQWISEQLGFLGIPARFHTTVGDDLEEMVEAFVHAAKRADVAILTGGLGPTRDDLTRQALADAAGAPLQLDEQSLQSIERLFASRGRVMPERNQIQACFPLGSQVIPNPHGTAPGIDLVIPADSPCRFFALPGVPAEMKQMWLESVQPAIDSMLETNLGALQFHTMKLFGIGESEVEVRLPDLIDRGRSPTVGITVSRATISLRIAGRAQTAEEFAALIQPTVAEIDGALGEYLFGEGHDEIQDAVCRQLRERQLTLACVEVGAASFLGDWLAGVEESEGQQFAGSMVFPTRHLAESWATVENEPAKDAFWESLAASVAEQFDADIGLAVGDFPTQRRIESAMNLDELKGRSSEFFESIVHSEVINHEYFLPD